MGRHGVLIATAALALAAIGGGAQAAAPPPRGGTISIEPRDASGDYDPSTQTFVDAAAQALAARGFTILHDPGHSAYVAELFLSRDDSGTAKARAPAGRAAATPGGSPGVGVGGAIPFSTGRSRLVPLRRSQMGVTIRQRGDADGAWPGAAMTVRSAGAREGADSRVASDLSEAILRAYPAQAAEVVGVP